MTANEFPSLDLIHTIVFDFDGIFTNNKVMIHEIGSEAVVCDRSDGLAFDILRAYQKIYGLNFNYFILSKESNPVVLSRAKKLKLPCKNAISNKLKYLENYFLENFPEYKNPFQGLVYLGNDLNDLPIMRRAGFSIAPSDAHPLVLKIAHIILPQRGGDGFIRAFIEKLLKIDSLSTEKIDELISNC